MSHHLLLSHGLAVDALRAGARAGVPVGITLNLTPMRPASSTDADRAAAWRMDGHQNRWFLDPVLRGAYPADMLDALRRAGSGAMRLDPEDLAVIGAPDRLPRRQLLLPALVRAAPGAAPLLRRGRAGRGTPRTAMGWAVDADGLYELLMRLRRDYGTPTIYITENGAAFDDGSWSDGVVEDPSRVAYLGDHLDALRRAVADGVDVRRYHAWSLLDNFEWEHGYAKRFGIVRVDYAHPGADPQAQRALVPRPHRGVAEGGSSMASIAFADVSKVFPDGTRAVDGLDLEIADGEFTVLVGPSGSGKSTALRMVAGLEDASVGRGVGSASGWSTTSRPRDRDIAMVFQSYALYPHMSVADNMGFALKMQRVGKESIRSRVGERRVATRHPRAGRAAAAGAERWPAPAGRVGPRGRPLSLGVPDGRAAVQPGREAARGDARVHRPAAPGPRHDDALRHARPDRGDDDGRPRGRDARRAPGAGRRRRNGSTSSRRTCSWPASSARRP